MRAGAHALLTIESAGGPRLTAAELIASLSGPDKDPSARVRATACRALVWSPTDPAATRALIDTLSDRQRLPGCAENEVVAVWAANSLGKMRVGCDHAVTALVRLVDDPNPRLAAIAIYSLGSLARTDASVVTPVVQVLGAAVNNPSTAPSCRSAAVRSLANLGPATATAMPVLLPLLDNKSFGPDAREVVKAVLRLGLAAAEAAPKCMDRLESVTDQEDGFLLLKAIEAAGRAGGVSGRLERWATTAKDPYLRGVAEKVARATR